MCAQRRLKSACASAQSDQGLRYPHEETLHSWLTKMRLVKILTRLRECASWSESSMGALVKGTFFDGAALLILPTWKPKKRHKWPAKTRLVCASARCDQVLLCAHTQYLTFSLYSDWRRTRNLIRLHEYADCSETYIINCLHMRSSGFSTVLSQLHCLKNRHWSKWFRITLILVYIYWEIFWL